MANKFERRGLIVRANRHKRHRQGWDYVVLQRGKFPRHYDEIGLNILTQIQTLP